MSREFLSVEEVVAIHDALIHETGGMMGLREVGALASAVMRPQIGYYDGIIEEAAALLESLTVNHPFVDGNKRTAFAVTDAFLRMNGSLIDCDSEETYRFFMRLFKNNAFRFAELREWLENHVRPLPTP